jgi:VWFA-related protein
LALVMTLAGCAPSGPSQAQTQAAQYAAIATTTPVFVAPREIAGRPGYVELNASVAGQSGSAIPSLKQADFIVDTSGVDVPIAFFRQSARTPMTIGILVDQSNSMKPKLAKVQLKLAEFINGLDPSDEVFLIAFSFQPLLLQPLTTDHQAVVQGLSQLHAFGLASIYDSIVFAEREFKKGRYTSKVILLITDGFNNASRVKEQDTVESLKATGLRLYAIGIGVPKSSDPVPDVYGPVTTSSSTLGFSWSGAGVDRLDAEALQEMAREAGGEAFIVPPMDKDDGKGFSGAVKTISGMIGHSYTIGVVVPPGTAASTLRITIANHPEAVVATHISPHS